MQRRRGRQSFGSRGAGQQARYTIGADCGGDVEVRVETVGTGGAAPDGTTEEEDAADARGVVDAAATCS